MKTRYILVISAMMVIYIAACGNQDESSADFYESCSFSVGEGTDDSSVCTEVKNRATDLQQKCESSTVKGRYAQTQCTVDAGSKGCVYKNRDGFDFTDWYTGSSWTLDLASSDCAKKTSGKVISKQ